MIKTNCENCNKELNKFKSQIPKSGKAFCSLSCSTSYRNKFEFNPSHTRNLSGENNPMFGKGHLIAGKKNGMYGRVKEQNPAWSGGRHKRSDGYYRILIDGERVLEHRHVLISNGLNINGSVVHHKNKDRADNTIANLEVMSQSEHITKHREDLQKIYA